MKIKSYDNKTINFHNKEIPEADSYHTNLAVVTIDSDESNEE